MIAFGSSVYVARQLGPSMFGVIGFASAVVLYFAHMAACGIDLPGMRDVAADRERMGGLASSIQTVRLLVSVGLTVVLAGGAWLFLPEPEATVLALYSLTLLAHGANPRWIHLGLESPKPVAASRLIGETLFFGSVLAVVHLPEHLHRVPLAQFAGDALGTVLLIAWLGRHGMRWRLQLDWAAVKPIFVRSFPLVLNILLGLMIFNADLILLRIFEGKASVGYYSASYQLISFLINMSWAYSFSLLPALSQANEESGERAHLYTTSLSQTFAIGLPIGVGGALAAAPIIDLVFEADYAPSVTPLAVLVLSVPFMLFKDIGLVGLIVRGREKTILKMTGVAMVVNLGLNLVVIPRYGMAGAAATTLFTEILRAAMAAWCVRREGLPLVGLSRTWRPIVAAAVMAGTLIALSPTTVLATLSLGAIAYALALFVTGGVELRRGGWPTLRV